MNLTTDHVSSERRLPHPILALDEFGARSRDGRGLVELTPTEFALLHYLAYLPPGKVAQYAEIARAIRPYDRAPLGNKIINWHVNEIRRKVSATALYKPGGCASWPRDVIITRRGFGVRLDWCLAAPSVTPHTNAVKRPAKNRQ